MYKYIVKTDLGYSWHTPSSFTPLLLVHLLLLLLLLLVLILPVGA